MSVSPSAKVRSFDELEKQPPQCRWAVRRPQTRDRDDSLWQRFGLHFPWMQLLTFSIGRTERGLQEYFSPGIQDERTQVVVSDLCLPCSAYRVPRETAAAVSRETPCRHWHGGALQYFSERRALRGPVVVFVNRCLLTSPTRPRSCCEVRRVLATTESSHGGAVVRWARVCRILQGLLCRCHFGIADGSSGVVTCVRVRTD